MANVNLVSVEWMALQGATGFEVKDIKNALCKNSGIQRLQLFSTFFHIAASDAYGIERKKPIKAK